MSIHIEGRRWFQKTYGNTYHTVRIWTDGKDVITSEKRYGYGDQYLQTAYEMMEEAGLIPVGTPYGGTRYLREELGASYSVVDVAREKDL